MNASVILKQFLKPEQLQRLTLLTVKTTAPVAKVAHKVGPEVLTGLGIAGGVTAAVLGARATLKLEPILDQAKTDITRAEFTSTIHNGDGERVYSDKQVKSATNKAKVHAAVQIGKVYLPAFSIGLASIGCVLAAHGVMRRRNVALVAAYNALEKSFNAYRKRVIDEYGEDKDRDYRVGFTDKTRKDKEGNEKTTTSVDYNAPSIYSKFFDEHNVNWEGNANYNLVFLNSQQIYANNMLNARGHVLLNDVYDALGIARTPQGAVCGWLKADHPQAGDGYIDFGIYDLDSERRRSFVNGQEKAILLDFNVDGMIYDKI